MVKWPPTRWSKGHFESPGTLKNTLKWWVLLKHDPQGAQKWGFYWNMTFKRGALKMMGFFPLFCWWCLYGWHEPLKVYFCVWALRRGNLPSLKLTDSPPPKTVVQKDDPFLLGFGWPSFRLCRSRNWCKLSTRPGRCRFPFRMGKVAFEGCTTYSVVN